MSLLFSFLAFTAAAAGDAFDPPFDDYGDDFTDDDYEEYEDDDFFGEDGDDIFDLYLDDEFFPFPDDVEGEKYTVDDLLKERYQDVWNG